MSLKLLFISLLFSVSCEAFTCLRVSILGSQGSRNNQPCRTYVSENSAELRDTTDLNKIPTTLGKVTLPLILTVVGADAAFATSTFGNSDFSAVPILSALTAYGHYVGLLVAVASLTAEKLLVKPNMNEDEENLLTVADAVYGIASALIFATGYFRITQYGKGWEFYAHEPIFWIKMALAVVLASSSFFPTVMIIKRAVDKKDVKEGNKDPSEVKPISEKLAKRMTKIINGELLALGSLPLAATLMSRGVGYTEWFPWQAGAAPCAVLLFGLGYKYVKEALTWTEDAL